MKFSGEPFACDCAETHARNSSKSASWLIPTTLKRWREEAAAEVDEAFATAQKEPVPNGDEEDWCAISTRDL